MIEKMYYTISMLILVSVIFYFIEKHSDCSDKGGVLVRTVLSGWRCVKLDELK